MPYALEPPPEVIASWPRPNYVNPDTRGPGVSILAIVLTVIGIIVVSARMFARFFLTRAPGIDDILVSISLAFAIAFSALVIVGDRRYYGGHHVWDTPQSVAEASRLNNWSCQWCYIAAATSVKVSVLLFYRRLSVKFSGTFLVATWIGIVYNVICLLAFCLILLLQCKPVNAYWRSANPIWRASHDYQCIKEQLTLPMSGVCSVIGDFYSTVLPMLLIRNLMLPFRQKVALYALFAVGFIVVIAGIIRTVKLHEFVSGSYDFTWTVWEAWIWTLVEIYLALICASAPALKPFFKRFFDKSFGTSRTADRSNAKNVKGYSQMGSENLKGSGYGSRIARGALHNAERGAIIHSRSEVLKSPMSTFTHEAHFDETTSSTWGVPRSGIDEVPLRTWKITGPANWSNAVYSKPTVKAESGFSQHRASQRRGSRQPAITVATSFSVGFDERNGHGSTLNSQSDSEAEFDGTLATRNDGSKETLASSPKGSQHS